MHLTPLQKILGGMVVVLAVTGILVYRTKISVQDSGIVARSEHKPVPDILLYDYEGREFRLAQLKGRPAIVTVWATWCTICQREYLLLADARKKFGNVFEVIAVNREEAPETAKSSLVRPGIEQEVLFVLDQDDALYGTIDGFAMPELLFVDQEGNVRYHQRGFVGQEELKRIIEQTFGLSAV